MEAVKRPRQEADALTGALLQSVFYEMFGDPVRNEKGWEVKSFGDLALIKDVDHRMPQAVDSGIPLISPINFKEHDKIDFENAKKISEEDYQRMCKKIQPHVGDILYSRYGTICEARLVPEGKKFQISYSLCIIRPTTPNISLKFLFWFLKMPFVKQEISKKQRSSCIPDLGLAELNKIKIPLPSLALQQQFVRIVEDVERVRERQVESKREIDMLFEGLMTTVFSGELVTNEA